MTDYRALVDEAREWSQREAEELGDNSYSVLTLNEFADAVEALVAENEKLRTAHRLAVQSRNRHKAQRDTLFAERADIWDKGVVAGSEWEFLDAQAYTRGEPAIPRPENPYRNAGEDGSDN